MGSIYKGIVYFTVSMVSALMLIASTQAQTTSSNDTTPVVTDESAPAETIDIKVSKVLKKYCAACHTSSKKLGNFDFVLDLNRLVETPKYITPRNPDLSFLLTRMRSQTMPPSGSPRPSKAELKIVSDWISQVKTSREKIAAKRTPIERDDLMKAMRDDLDQFSPEEQSRTRYFTVHNLYNAGDSGKKVELWRRALSKTLNSLSWQSIVVPVKLGPKNTLLRVNLDDLGWTNIVWDRLLAQYPYGLEPEEGVSKDIAIRTGTPQPFIRADWLAFNATRPPLYFEILGLPKTTQQLEKIIGADVEKNIKTFRVRRAGFRESGVSEYNRLIERHPLLRSSGSYWKSYDFGGNAGRRNIFKYPLGPGGPQAFEHDGGEMIFSLPNGMQAYYLSTADGKRINVGPTNIVRDKMRPLEPEITNGISCMGCHINGMILTQDQVRDRVSRQRSLPPKLRRTVERLHPEWPTMQKLMFKDMKRFLTALDDAGVIKGFKRTDDGGFKVSRVVDIEAIRALSDRYDETLSMLQGAAELGLTLAQFEVEIDRASDRARAMKDELARGTLPRGVFENGFKVLAANVMGLTFLDYKAECEKALRKSSQSYIPKTPYIISCDGVERAKSVNLEKKPPKVYTEEKVTPKTEEWAAIPKTSPTYPPTVVAPPRRDYNVYRNYDLYGGDFARSKKGRWFTEAQCQNTCRGNKRCVAYTYNSKLGVCFLKDSIAGGLKPWSGAISGVLTTIRQPPVQQVESFQPRPPVRRAGACGRGYASYDNTDYLGNDIAGFRGNFSSCRRRCLNSVDCVGFSWIKKRISKRCWLKYSMRRPSRKRGVLSCLKS